MEHKLSVPVAIVIAGVLIAGALFFTRSSSPTATSAEVNEGKEVNLTPVSSDDHILGSPRADIIIVEYSDTECPFCKEFHSTMHQVIDTYGKDERVAWVYRHFPIDQLHKKARKEAEAAECAADQGGNSVFWKYVDRIYEVTQSNDKLDPAQLPLIAKELGLNTQTFENCLSNSKFAEKIESNYQDALAAGGRGTPHNVLIAKEKFSDSTIDLIRTASQQLPPRTLTVSADETKLVMIGALPYDLIKLIVDSILESSSH